MGQHHGAQLRGGGQLWGTAMERCFGAALWGVGQLWGGAMGQLWSSYGAQLWGGAMGQPHSPTFPQWQSLSGDSTQSGDSGV